MVLEQISVIPKIYYPMVSGTDVVVQMMERESKLKPSTGVFQVLQKMVATETVPSVGGHTQVAVC